MILPADDSPADDVSDTTNIYDKDSRVWTTVHRDDEDPDWDDVGHSSSDDWYDVTSTQADE